MALGAATLAVWASPAAASNPDVTVTQTVDQDTVVAGDEIDYHLTIDNTGDVALTGVTVLDPKTPDCAGEVANLDPGDTVTVDCSYTTVDPDDVGTRTNKAAVTSNEGALEISNQVSTTVEAPLHELTVTKAATEASVIAGDTIHYQVEVANTGNLDLTGVALTDTNVPDCDSSIGDMAPDDSTTVDCTYTTGASDVGTFSNTATGSSNETSPTDSNQVDVTVAAEDFALSATKSVDEASVVAGEDLHYHVAISNDGNRTVTGISVADVKAPDCAGGVTDLAPGANTTVDCAYTTTAGDVGTYSNTATVSSNEADDAVSNQVSSTVVAASPSITIQQTVDESSVFVTQNIDLHLTLHNTGNQTLTGVTIIDPHATDCAGAVDDLAPGASTTIDCAHVALSTEIGTYHNTAAVDTNQTTLLASNQIHATIQGVSCGEPVTVYISEGQVPTNGDDVIFGTPGPDVINALGGRDIVCSIGGADVIDGGSGNDFLFGLNGDDTIHGGSGNDNIDGGEGNDTLFGDGGNDEVHGSDGDDHVDGGPGRDLVIGEIGNDVVTGGSDDDNILGNQGNDSIDGGGGNDTIFAGADVDTVVGGPGNDSVNGGGGDDTISGGDGVDFLTGKAGNDTITGDDGADTLLGGDGNDTLDGNAGNDQVYGQAGNDIMNGESENDILSGGDGNDIGHGNGGNDIVFGDAGNDHVFGDAGIDRVLGGSGNDHISGGTGIDDCEGDTGFDAGDSSCETSHNIP
jgi:Ca2+-binding RTX toxin-like protein